MINNNKSGPKALLFALVLLFTVLAVFRMFGQEIDNTESNDQGNETGKDDRKHQLEEKFLKTLKKADFTEKLYDYKPLSSKYFRGLFLIYDCQNRHFACVDELSYIHCQEWREEDKRNNLQILSCAPLKQFSSYTECVHNHYSLIHKDSSRLFCRNISNSKGDKKQGGQDVPLNSGNSK